MSLPAQFYKQVKIVLSTVLEGEKKTKKDDTESAVSNYESNHYEIGKINLLKNDDIIDHNQQPYTNDPRALLM